MGYWAPSMVRSARVSALRAAGIALLLAGAVVYFPNRAAAECGHYVSILNSSEATDQSPNPDRPSSPCQGPSCSQHQPIPFAPVASKILCHEANDRRVIGLLFGFEWVFRESELRRRFSSRSSAHTDRSTFGQITNHQAFSHWLSLHRIWYLALSESLW